MKAINIFLSVILSLIVIIIIMNWVKSEFRNIEAIKSGEAYTVSINSLSCNGKRKFIKFNLNKKEYIKRIYIGNDECRDLKNQSSIKVKILNPDTIIFENEDYNDWFEAEIISTILLGVFSLFCIFIFVLRRK